MNPAAPVTRIRTAASYASPFVALAVTASPSVATASSAEPLRVADLGPVALELPRLLEVLERLVALTELGQRRAEVVLRVRLVGLAGTCKRGQRQPRESLGARGVAVSKERSRPVGQAGAVGLGRGRLRWWTRRRWRRRRRWLRSRCAGAGGLGRLR